MTLDDLKMCRTYANAIRSIEESIERLRSEMERTTQVLSLAPAHSGSKDKIAEQVRRMEELEIARAREIADMEAYIDRCRVWLSTIPEQQALILSLRYIEGLEWEDIARVSHYSKGHCTKIHTAAKKRLEDA